MAPVTHPVYLVRHGESEWNVLRVTQGQMGILVSPRADGSRRQPQPP